PSDDDRLDPHPQEILPVSAATVVALAPLVLDDADLRGAHGVEQRGLDPGAGNDGVADTGAAVAEDHEDPIELDLRALLGRDRKELDVEDVPLLDPVLLPARFDHCEQDDTPFSTPPAGE